VWARSWAGASAETISGGASAESWGWLAQLRPGPGISFPGSGSLPLRNSFLRRAAKSLTNIREVSSDPQIDTVRGFNRAVTQRVGALDDHYLARDRPLGEARVLWEIGTKGCDVRVIRSRLALDSGYLSRILRSLEAAGLITMSTSEQDKRVRTARLTKTGRAERAELDRRSDALARSMLDPLTVAQRERLVSAMSQVQKLLTVSLIEIQVVDPVDPIAQHCLRQYFAELDRRFDAGFDLANSLPAPPDEMRPPAGIFLVASLSQDPIGCGALKFHGDEPTELKRMWVAPTARGLGVGRRLLRELENRAFEGGSRAIRLETNRALTEAVAMYRSAGYREVDAFNDEPYGDHWFEKQLGDGVGDVLTESDTRYVARGPLGS
jgi:DNA-binding MarR family transcriptional regulator/GNAT superfamily N-acetyltransferase